jgi:hypothetical protein
VNDINFCGIFQGTIKVFGRDHVDTSFEILSMIDQILSTQDPASFHSELVRITSVNELSQVKGVFFHQSDEGLSSLGKGGISLAAIILLTAFLGFFFIGKKRSTLKKSETMKTYSSSSQQHQRKNALLTRLFLKKKRHAGADYDPEAKSIRPSESDCESVDLGPGNRLLLSEGRPVEIEFDISYSTTACDESSAEPMLDPRTEGII